ncbi:MAG: hypothetical protein ACFFDN_45020 [Candidatus Hodarchaeota archaeon]
MAVTKKKIGVVLFVIAFWAGIDYMAFQYQTNEWNRTFVWPDGWLHKVRSISFKGNDFNDDHGLNLNVLSTLAGYPNEGAEDGLWPGVDSPWKAWTDWTSYNYQIGKDEELLEGYEIFTWYSAFRVMVPGGFEGHYDINVGSDDSIKIWKDGKLIHNKSLLEERRIIMDDDVIENIYFHEGQNVFIVGLYQKTDITGFCFRIKDHAGTVMPWIGFYYWITLPSPNYGYEITLISICLVAAFIWVYFFY